MARILLLVIVAILVWWAFRLMRNRQPGDDGGSRVQPPAARALEPISQCAWCGVHVPAGSAASLPDGRIYCSEAHRDQARLAAPSDRAGS